MLLCQYLIHSIREPIPKGEIPGPINPPPGCRFHPRCASVESMCTIHEPDLVEVRSGHWEACFE
ncbi:MAG: hypothetical protein JSW12_15535 [Deltaproteobacteria bacterium]|nr:MAG: hypothetical protein JSW12_15535 [Deltaproteobacteria bacterium]